MPSLNCLATVAQAKQKPSWVDGIPPDLEEELCVFGCQQIQQAGILLHLPQVAMGCAQVLFQRFWFVSSMRQFSMMDIAMGAVLLASKLAEDPLRLRDVLLVFDYLEQRARHVAHHVPGPRLRESQQSSSAAHILPFTYKPSGYYSDAYYDAKDAIVVAEMQILKRLGFDVQVTLPHALMINYLQILGIVDHELEILGTPSTAAQVAWGYLNDALQSPVYCLFPPHVIACASIYLLTLQPNKLHKPLILPLQPSPWWTIFDVTREELRVSASHILRLYDGDRGLASRVREDCGGLIDLSTKSRIRSWIERHA